MSKSKLGITAAILAALAAIGVALKKFIGKD